MTGKKLLDTILLGVMLLSTFAVVGLFYYTEKMYRPPPINEVAEQMDLMETTVARAIPTFFKVDKLTISLTPKAEITNTRMRWLEAEVHLVLFETDDVVFIKRNLPIIQDRIIEIASRMSPEELNSLSGKILLEDRLRREINKGLGKISVKNIFFASYIVQ